MRYDYLIVGAGLCGCVLAERLASHGNYSVLLIEQRNHIGGNCADFFNSEGLLVHQYGPHWFHTNDFGVFEYLSKFTEWRFHEHRVRSFIEGMLLPFPINRRTLNELYGLKLQSDDDTKAFYESVRNEKITQPRNAEEMILSQVGWDLYEKFYRNYTIKQWGMDPKNLASTVTARIPIRTNNDDRYFTDRFQGVPRDGYSNLFQRMLNHKGIDLVLNTDYKDVRNLIQYSKMIYTGSIDNFFDYRFGKLPYRSLRFEHETFAADSFQSFQQVNYPNNFDFTRIIEWKHATGQRCSKTTITREYPCAYDHSNEMLYPILTEENLEIVRKYQNEAVKLRDVTFCGRLAEYKYFNMDQIVARALSIYRRIEKREQWTN